VADHSGRGELVKSPVWVWRRRARFLAKWLTIVLFAGLGILAVTLLADATTFGWWGDAAPAIAMAVIAAFLFCVFTPAIGILALEKVARELFIRREIIKQKIKERALAAGKSTLATGKGAMAKGESSLKKSQNWVADGFKEEEDKRSSDEQE